MWFEDLNDVMKREFRPSLFGNTVSKDEVDLFTLPTRMGGLGVRDPMSLTEVCFQASQLGSKVIMEYLSGKEEEFSVADHYHIFGGEKLGAASGR